MIQKVCMDNNLYFLNGTTRISLCIQRVFIHDDNDIDMKAVSENKENMGRRM